MKLLGETVRLKTEDDLELQGILFEPKGKTKNALIHVHAWIGNFYENRFIDFIAKEAVKRGIAFLTFNNRGAGIVTDFIRRKGKDFAYKRIGGSLERFEDCIKDVKSAIDFLNKRGYKKIILQGHSTGCQKITYYKHKTKDERVKGLIELSPVDDVAVARKLLGKRYEEAIEIANKMMKSGKSKKAVTEWMAFYPLLSAERFLSISDSKSSSGKMFLYSGEMKELKNINCPMLAIFGSKDIYQENPKEKLKILKRNVKKCDAKLFKDATHWFDNKETELAKTVVSWSEAVIKK